MTTRPTPADRIALLSARVAAGSLIVETVLAVLGSPGGSYAAVAGIGSAGLAAAAIHLRAAARRGRRPGRDTERRRR